jgi:hypothetical protein
MDSMVKMPGDIQRIEDTSWDSLRKLATEALSTIPKSEYIIFETLSGLQWPQFQQMVLSLAGKSYAKIYPFRKQMERAGIDDFNNAEGVQLAIFATVNNRVIKSAKVEYWLLCRNLRRNPNKKLS